MNTARPTLLAFRTALGAAAIVTTSALLSALLCGCGGAQPPAPTTSATPYEAHCAEHLPVFTLGRGSSPTKAQEAALCTCIWNELGPSGREVSEQLFAHKQFDASEPYLRAFGAAVKKCGGMKL